MAAEWAGFETVAQCEIDEYASKVLAKNFKGVPNLHDIRTVTNERLAEFGIDGKEITVVSAGFPCQPYSLAGKGRGDCDSRDLWGEVARVLGEIRPPWFVGENTPGLFARQNQRFFRRVLDVLPRWGIASGGEFGELVTSEHLISETECLLLPTPTASEGFAYTRIAKKDVQRCVYRQHHPELRGKISGHTKRLIEYFAFLGIPLNQTVKLQEMIMGFPKGWTDLDASETR